MWPVFKNLAPGMALGCFFGAGLAGQISGLHLQIIVGIFLLWVAYRMFFGNKKFINFVKEAREMGINVPIIPGLKPLVTKSQLSMIPHRFKVDIPNELVIEVAKSKDNKAVKEIGIEWCIQQSKELLERGAPVLHYYTMGKSEITKRIASSVF